jgi:single-strand DNA-binding protein
MANFNLNKVILGGRLTADPELKTTPSGVSVTTFTIAVNRKYGGKDNEQTQADFIIVTAWRSTAEFVSRFFRKASSICVVGSIQTRSWTDQQGQKHFATEIVADEAYFVDSKSESANDVQPNAQLSTAYVPESYTAQPPKFEDVTDDEEMPF